MTLIGAVIVMKSKLLCANCWNILILEERSKWHKTDKVEWVFKSYIKNNSACMPYFFTVSSMMCYSQDCPLCLIFHMTIMPLQALLGTMKHSPEDTAKKLSVFPKVIRLACDSFLQLDESKGVRSGDLGGATLPVGWVRQPTSHLSNITSLPLCGGAPSWAHHIMHEPPILLAPESFPLIQDSDYLIIDHLQVSLSIDIRLKEEI